MRPFLNITLTCILLFGGALFFSSSFQNENKVFDVHKVKAEPRVFEEMEFFRIRGNVKPGLSIPGIVKAFPLKDLKTPGRVFIIPKQETIPKPDTIPQTFKVMIKKEIQIGGASLLLLQEL